jgi:hypothetical protein
MAEWAREALVDCSPPQDQEPWAEEYLAGGSLRTSLFFQLQTWVRRVS